jgi:putative PIN family toxin of toxin-antitoxin system
LIVDVATKVFPARKVENICRDADDDKYIDCAIESQSAYIVSGDNDLLVLKEYADIKIVTAKEYLEIVNK